MMLLNRYGQTRHLIPCPAFKQPAGPFLDNAIIDTMRNIKKSISLFVPQSTGS